MSGNPMRLRDYLAVPYMLEAETVETTSGAWLTRVSYLDLPGCRAEAPVVEEALQRLERLRIETIVAMVRAGKTPPVPRPPLRDCDPVWAAQQAGLPDDIVTLIARDAPAATDAPKQRER
jgi:hypothetical protein